MKACPCPKSDQVEKLSSFGHDKSAPSQPASLWRRGAGVAGWIFPSATLFLMPKCPVCVAMWVMLWTGVGISVSTASQVRSGLIILCVISLACIVIKTATAFWRHARKRPY